jgi:6-pyruvoyltetrahydropterin/6-carboxytetrahydropterin synthase
LIANNLVPCKCLMKKVKLVAMFEIMVEGTFDAAHQLVGHKGPCENLHGHTWKVQAVVSGNKLNKLGLLIDFKEMKKKLYDILDKLDHTCLNKTKPFDKVNPTSENVAVFIHKELAKKLDKTVKIARITVYESAVTSATYII